MEKVRSQEIPRQKMAESLHGKSAGAQENFVQITSKNPQKYEKSNLLLLSLAVFLVTAIFWKN